MEARGSEWAWVCPAGCPFRRSLSLFIFARRDLSLLSRVSAVRVEEPAPPQPHPRSPPLPHPTSRGTPPLPEAYPPARLLSQGLGDRIEVGFAAEEPMQKDEGWAGRLPIQELVGKRHRSTGRGKDGG